MRCVRIRAHALLKCRERESRSGEKRKMSMPQACHRVRQLTSTTPNVGKSVKHIDKIMFVNFFSSIGLHQQSLRCYLLFKKSRMEHFCNESLLTCYSKLLNTLQNVFKRH